MANIHVQIIGAKEFKAAFNKAPQQFVKTFDVAIKRAVLTIQGAARVGTPVDTGFLRGPGYRTTFAALTGTLENVAPYAAYVHDGTSRMKARPFLQDGVDAVEGQVDAIFSKAMDDFTNNL